ncbi:MAG: transcription antitermination factor NusB [Crocinitomicaceae bacterium]|nr:transcription antitermination factor NusB [Crocinitomicaceae bacterium]
MLNRRHLRVKVLQSLYAYFQSKDGGTAVSEKELLTAVDRIFDLYLYLLLTFDELKALGTRRIEDAKKKMRPREEDLNPNTKFIDNQFISILGNHPELRACSEDRKVNWVGDEDQEMLRKMYLGLLESETYFEFMNNESKGFEEDRAFAIAVFKSEIANFPLLYDFFEEKSIHWMDDIDLACSMVVKTLKNFNEEGPNQILPLYKDKEDEVDFIRQLLRKTISMDAENEKLIDDLTSNWELDRIAKMDVILMKMAITELQVFNNIPTKVTLNEYIEISKFYSTPKSNGFINGVLDKAIGRLDKEGLIKKVGRGLKE